MSDLYRVTGAHSAEIRAALPDGLVFATLDEALAARGRHPDLPLATLDGEVLRAGMLEGGRAVKGFLVPRREIREIGERREPDRRATARGARPSERSGA